MLPMLSRRLLDPFSLTLFAHISAFRSDRTLVALTNDSSTYPHGIWPMIVPRLLEVMMILIL